MSILLPRLRPDAAHLDFTPGPWTPQGGNFLNRLGDCLEDRLDHAAPDSPYSVSSIPTPWARALLFYSALRDANHTMHQQVLGEWRGLLALLALREYYPRVSFTSHLFDYSAIPQTGMQINADIKAFEQVICELFPSRMLAQDTPWRKFTLFVVNEEAVGLTSPATLVFTRADLPAWLPIPWKVGSKLTDPLNSLDRSQRALLGAWINKLEDDLTKHPDRNTVIFNMLVGLLEKFKLDCGKNVVTLTFANVNNGMNYGFYKYMNQPVKPKTVSPQESMVRIKPSRKSVMAPPLYVIDKKIAQEWNMPEHEIKISDVYDLSLSPNLLQQGPRMLGNYTLPDNGEWRKAEDFFTDRLFLVESPDAFTSVLSDSSAKNIPYSQGYATPILPVRKELLEYLTPEDLAKRITFQILNNNEYLVTLRLPLTGPGNTGKDYSVSVLYGKDRKVVTSNSMPVLEMWPDFVLPDWKYYLLIFVPGMDTFQAEPCAVGGKVSRREITLSHPLHTTPWIAKMDVPPDAVVCKFQQNDVGLLLLGKKTPRPIANQVGEWKIGIDFGTTRTNIFACVGKNAPKSMKFKKRFLPITKTAAVDRAIIDWLFTTESTDKEWPYLSLYHYHVQPAPQDIRAILDGNYYYFEPEGRMPDKDQEALKFFLKWSDKADDRRWMGALLEQLCLESLAEAVGSGATGVYIQHSYPSAFSDGKVKQLGQTWDGIIKRLKSFYAKINIDLKQRELPEGIAAARFFREDQKNFHQGVMIIDIGGVTSDISFWQKNKLLYQNSIRFAGREIFIDVLKNFIDVLGRQYTPDEFKEENRRYKNRERDDYRASAEWTLEVDGGKWIEHIHEHIAEPETIRFVNILTFGIGGLLFYTGLALKQLCLHKDLTRRYIGDVIPHIYIAGNGSNIFKWITGGVSFEKPNPIHDVLRAIFQEASGLKEALPGNLITLSPIPKAEAAYGLVCDPVLLPVKEWNTEPGVISGENFCDKDGNEYGWDYRIENSTYAKHLHVNKDLPQIRRFIETYNGAISTTQIEYLERLDLDDDLRTAAEQINLRLDSNYSIAANRPDDVVVVPPFLGVVTGLLEALTVREM